MSRLKAAACGHDNQKSACDAHIRLHFIIRAARKSLIYILRRLLPGVLRLLIVLCVHIIVLICFQLHDQRLHASS